MGAAKELWFAEMERLAQWFIEQGIDEDTAYEKASNMAQHSVVDRMAYQADAMRKRSKGE